jgi:CubicO group peptidase (beta-lactamase class C family)
MQISRVGVVLVIGFLVSSACSAQRLSQAAETETRPVDDLSPLLAESVQKHKLPGMAAAIVDGGRITALGAAGVRCREHQERITTDDLFHIGSDTKSMTATLIALFVEEGKLKWNSTPIEVLGSRGVKEIDPAWQRVTLDELLTHRAGVVPNPDLVTMLGGLGQPPREQRMRVCRVVLRKPPDHEPGKDFLYSNTGYIIAGAMLEAVADDSWENLMISRLCKPLGMKHVGFGAPGALPTKPAKEAASAASDRITQPWGHLSDGEAVKPGPDADNPPCVGPAGRVHLTLADWARYAMLHLAAEQRSRSDGAGATKPLLSMAALRHLHTPFGGAIDVSGTKYAMGWGVRELPGARGIELTHAGSNTMWYAVISLRMSEDRAILIVTNQGGERAGAACAEVKSALLKRADRSHAPRK